MNYLSGNSYRDRSVRLSAGGIPACLGPLRRIVIEQDPVKLRFVLTILFSSRALKSSPNPSIAPIVDPMKVGASTAGLAIFAVKFWKQLGYLHGGKTPSSLNSKRFHFSCKSGPNPPKWVGSALNAWLTDFLALDENLKIAICELGGKRMKEFCELADRYMPYLKGMFSWALGGKLRKLSYFADKEGKTRVIAIGDYFSQTVLKRLHSYLFRVLRKIPQDMTFDQGAFKEHIKDW